MIIKGNTVGTPMPRTNYEQTDPAKADYLKGKEVLDQKIENAKTAADNAQTAADNAQTAADNAQAYAENLGKAKAGFIYPLASAVVPDGFLLCDGAEYARTEYPELFAAIGTMYGSGDGSTTFNVPNLIERVPAGSGYYHTVGEMVGEETHKLTVEEMPSHNHSYETAKKDTGTSWIGQNGTSALRTTVTTDSGSDQPHNNMQPTTFIYGYIIATGKNTAVSVQDIILGAQAIPLGVEYGGTGATDPKTARDNLEITPENIGAMSMELLWENASPTSAFSEQTINLDFSGFEFVFIEFVTYVKSSNYAHYRRSEMAVVGSTHKVIGFGEHGSNFSFRGFSTTISSIKFETAKYADKYNDDDLAGSNNLYVPLKIYGIKGVSE